MARCRLTRNASAGLNLSVTADAVPPPLTRGGFGIPQSFASSPEAPLPGELSAKQTERLDEGRPGREAFAGLNLSVTADAVPPPLPRGGLGSLRKVNGFARGSPTRGNGDDRRQRRKQGVAVGAAASRMQATAQQTLGAATRPCLRSRLRGCTEQSLCL